MRVLTNQSQADSSYSGRGTHLTWRPRERKRSPTCRIVSPSSPYQYSTRGRTSAHCASEGGAIFSEQVARFNDSSKRSILSLIYVSYGSLESPRVRWEIMPSFEDNEEHGFKASLSETSGVCLGTFLCKPPAWRYWWSWPDNQTSQSSPAQRRMFLTQMEALAVHHSA
jgi:hypothetical protein